jgi:hypothetical protein
MLTRTLTAFAIVAALWIPVGAWACKAAGANTHVGVLKSVDAKAKSFTIIDAETRSPITFVSDEAILKDLAGVKGTIGVSYEETGGVFRAREVVRY